MILTQTLLLAYIKVKLTNTVGINPFNKIQKGVVTFIFYITVLSWLSFLNGISAEEIKKKKPNYQEGSTSDTFEELYVFGKYAHLTVPLYFLTAITLE